MSKMINFGIDLGTTNSLIAKFDRGDVEVFKNPNGFKETLPSVVGFRKERILIGDQARTYVTKQPKDVIGQFKTKMGTKESFRVPALGKSVTPVELSAFILKELKTFVYTGEIPEAAVITIPASFDMVQSEATREAGHQAGFKQVVLLQEPIAASLAYANKSKDDSLKNSQWLVYDLGGGTFDVALVKIVEGELKIIDHEGNNYLGGKDFDQEILSKLIAPELEKEGNFEDLLGQMKSESGKHNRLWLSLLSSAEEAKVMLSTRTSADIGFDTKDDDGKEIEIFMTITRSEFEALIKEYIDSTAEMVRTILTHNSLQTSDLEFVLMVGGSTYIPYVRNRIRELLEIPVKCEIDPITAIAMGAAYFAANREISIEPEEGAEQKHTSRLKVKVAYSRISRDDEELFAARAEGDIEGLFYRIVREDGGFDSGLKQLSERISEDLPLQENAYNLFRFTVFDRENNPVEVDTEPIQIAQGGIIPPAGQPLSEDISLVYDDPSSGENKLRPLFRKNSILPAKIRETVEVLKTLIHGSEDELLRIIVVEGPSENHFTVNKTVGHLAIWGKQVSRDIPKGTELDLTFEMSESRQLSVSVYVNATDQEFSEVFEPQFREVSIETLSDEIQLLGGKLQEELEDAEQTENYEAMVELTKLEQPIEKLQIEAALLVPDDVTDDRYKLQDRKRQIAQKIYNLTSGKRLREVTSDYLEAKEECFALMNESGNDYERRAYNEIIAQEDTFIESTNPQRIEAKIEELRTIGFQILQRTPAFLVGSFNHWVEERERFNDQPQAKSLIDAGKIAIEMENWDRLAEIDYGLFNLLPESEQAEEKRRMLVTGIGRL